jgi:hypothetical protein
MKLKAASKKANSTTNTSISRQLLMQKLLEATTPQKQIQHTPTTTTEKSNIEVKQKKPAPQPNRTQKATQPKKTTSDTTQTPASYATPQPRNKQT